MKASILIVLLSLLMASISIGSSIKMVVDSPKIVSATGLQGISKLNVNASHLGDKGEGNFSHLYGNAQIYEGTVAERQTFGDMGGEEMVERQTFGDMGGEEMVERRTFEGWSGNGTSQGNVMEEGIPEVFSELSPTTIVYFGESSIPLSTYQNTLGKYLWIESYGGLRQFASVSQYSNLYLMAYTSTSGPGEFLEMYPSASNQGIYQKTNFYFNSGYNRIPYRSDIVGRHYLLFSMKDQSSNAVIIDVGNSMGTSSPIILGTAPVQMNY